MGKKTSKETGKKIGGGPSSRETSVQQASAHEYISRKQSSHRISVCVSCRHKGSDCHPGYALIEHLRAAIAAAGPAVSEDFEISGVACMAGCTRPCTVAYHGTRKATYLFGDIDPTDDIADLVAFARQYAVLHDGWCSSVDRPGKLRKSTLARVPAAVIVMSETGQNEMGRNEIGQTAQ